VKKLRFFALTTARFFAKIESQDWFLRKAPISSAENGEDRRKL
jgi:hypothetical protein